MNGKLFLKFLQDKAQYPQDGSSFVMAQQYDLEFIKHCGWISACRYPQDMAVPKVVIFFEMKTSTCPRCSRYMS